MASDYERPPLYRYFPAYTKIDLRDDRPHKIKWKDGQGCEMETLIYIDDGTHDIEFAVVENRERFDEAVDGQGWKDKVLFTVFPRVLRSIAREDWLAVVAQAKYQGGNQTTANFQKAWLEYLQKRFNCENPKAVMIRYFNQLKVRKPEKLDPNEHEKRILVMFRVLQALPGTTGEVPDRELRVWYYYTFCAEDRAEFCERPPKDPAETPIREITRFMKGLYDQKVRRKEITPYKPGEYARIQEQSAQARHVNERARSRSRSKSPRIPRKRGNSGKRPKSPRDHGQRERRSGWRDQRNDQGRPSWRRDSRRGRDYGHGNGRYQDRGGFRGGGRDQGRNNTWRRNDGDRGRRDGRHDDRRRDGNQFRRDGDGGRRPESHYQDDDRGRSRSRSRASSGRSRDRSEDSEDSRRGRSRSRSRSRSRPRSRSRSPSEERKPEAYAAEFAAAESEDEEPVLPKNIKKEKQARARKALQRRRRESKGEAPQQDSDDEEFYTPKSSKSRLSE